MQSTTDAAKLSLKKTGEKKQINKQSVAPKPDDIEHIIVIGNTGLGKSSLIKLLTKNNTIKTANTTDACTTHTQCYPLKITDKDNDNNKVIHSLIYDTQGTQDTKDNNHDNDNDKNSMSTKEDGWKKDDEVLNEIQRFIYKSKGIKIKFIWIVPSMERMQADLQRQARFISKFTSKENGMQTDNSDNQDKNENDMDTSKIWDSVLIIVHKPELDADLIDECAKGAIGASNKYGSKTKWVENKNIIGYCNIDWLPQKRQKKAQKRYKQQVDQDDVTLFYYYKSNEIESLVLKSLLSLPSSSIEWRNDKCVKCNFEGDKRFSNDVSCHTRSYWSHKTGAKPKLTHLGILDKNYRNYFHSGKLMKVHPKPKPKEKYHPGKKCQREETALESGTLVARAAITQLRLDDNDRMISAPALAGLFVVNALTLNLLGAVVGVLGETDDMLYYDCCNAPQIDFTFYNGCTPVVINSNKKNAKGYLCCMKEEGSDGCKKYYKCCPQKNENAQGCITKCTNCNTIVNGDHEKKQEVGQDCGFYWPCCDKKGKIVNLNDNKLKCTKYCTFCDKEWGKSKGCNSNQKHNFNGVDEGEDEKKNYNHNSDAVRNVVVKKRLPRKNVLNPLIIIVCIEKYQDKSKNVLTSRNDYNNWIDLFDKHLKFGENIIKNDIDKPLNKNDFLHFLDSIFVNEKLRDNSDKKYDSIVFTYSGHGKFKDKIYFSDEKCLSFESIFSRFDGGDDNLQSFVGLPKIFIIDVSW